MVLIPGSTIVLTIKFNAIADANFIALAIFTLLI